MDQKILWAVNQMPKTDDKNLPIMGLEEIAKARTFHESFPQYTKTPLTKLDHMAAYLGVKEIYLKDESYRFWPQCIQGSGRFLLHGPLHCQGNRQGRIRTSLLSPHF